MGALAVALGAFGAHGLEKLDGFTPERLAWWSTAARYHLIHAVALLAVTMGPSRSVWTQRLWVAGILVFSGTLYAMGLGGPRWLGAITPVGGAALIAGWLSLWRRPSPTS
jgi:uncharacterized membrane protein YgdD (TMEM256/DUF423 family)